MQTFYEVWDFETRNVIGSFDSEPEARALLEKILALNGAAGVRELAILKQEPTESGEYIPTLVIEGSALAAEHVSRA